MIRDSFAAASYIYYFTFARFFGGFVSPARDRAAVRT